MLTHLEQAGYEKNEIILIPPPPSDAEAWKKVCEVRDNVKLDKWPKTNEINRKYYDACVRMGKKHKLPKVKVHFIYILVVHIQNYHLIT